jgi:hypothetical protein
MVKNMFLGTLLPKNISVDLEFGDAAKFFEKEDALAEYITSNYTAKRKHHRWISYG